MLHLAFCRFCSRAHYLLQASLSSASINVESTIVARRSSGSRRHDSALACMHHLSPSDICTLQMPAQMTANPLCLSLANFLVAGGARENNMLVSSYPS